MAGAVLALDDDVGARRSRASRSPLSIAIALKTRSRGRRDRRPGASVAVLDRRRAARRSVSRSSWASSRIGSATCSDLALGEARLVVLDQRDDVAARGCRGSPRRRSPRRANANLADLPARDRRAHGAAVEHAGEGEVVDVARAPGDLRGSLLARDVAADDARRGAGRRLLTRTSSRRFRLVAAVIVGGVRPLDPGVRDDPVAAQAPEVLEAFPAAVRVLLQELRHALTELPDHVRADGVIEHRGGADLDRAAAEQEVIERVREVRDAADAREAPVGQSRRHLRHLREREREDRRAAEAALEVRPSTFISNSSVSASMSVSDVNVLDDEIASAPPRNAPRASTTMSVVDGVSLAQIGTRATSYDVRDDRDLLLVLADVRAHVLAIHVGAGQVELERVDAFVLAGLRERLPVPELLVGARARHDRRDEHLRRVRLLDAREAADPPVERLVGDRAPSSRTECSAAPGRFFIERCGESASARRKFVFGPLTLTTGCRPIVFVTTPPQPASNARRMFDSRLGRRRRGEQEGILEANAGEDGREVGAHGARRSAGHFTPRESTSLPPRLERLPRISSASSISALADVERRRDADRRCRRGRPCRSGARASSSPRRARPVVVAVRRAVPGRLVRRRARSPASGPCRARRRSIFGNLLLQLLEAGAQEPRPSARALPARSSSSMIVDRRVGRGAGDRVAAERRDRAAPSATSAISGVAIVTPSGSPFAMPFAIVMMSGSTPQCSMPHILPPVRPKPVCTSSQMKTPPYLRTIPTAILKYSVRRRDEAADALDRLGEEAGDLAGRRRPDQLLDVLARTRRRSDGYVEPQRAAVAVRRRARA